jgi:hypothetical protein
MNCQKRLVLKPYDLGSWAHRLQSNCLHAAFFITRVDFADGSSWTWENPPGTPVQQLWEQSFRVESAKSCDNSAATHEALGRVTGTGWPAPGGSDKIWR